MKPFIKAVRLAASVGALLGLSTGAAAQSDYPRQVVRMVVPYPPGGTTDILGRVISEKLGERLKQNVIVENRPGAGGNIGVGAVAKAAPDGHTLVFTAVTTPAIALSMHSSLTYDLRKDLTPIAVVGSVPFVLVVANKVPAKSVQELLALAKTQPGTLNFGSAGVGTTAHMSGELFKSVAAINIVHVPYKGNGPALADLMGGHLQMMFDFLPSAVPHIKEGKMRPLVVSSPKRSAALPDVPTAAEAGVPAWEVLSYFGVLAPAQTPKAVIDRLNAELNHIAGLPDIKQRYAREGVEPAAESVEWASEYLEREITRWGKVVKDAGLRVK
jgi:tripartite-type tricarboxylate transporter receptor subunit TctC